MDCESPEQPRIFDLLVDDENDMIGIVAYAIYKKQKSELIQDFRGKNSGAYPSNDQLRQFYDLSRTPLQREHYHAKAVDLLQAFSQATAANAIKAASDEMDSEYNRKLASALENLKHPSPWKGFWASVASSVVGSFFFVLAIGLLIFILSASKFGLKNVIEQFWNVRIVSSDSIGAKNPDHSP